MPSCGELQRLREKFASHTAHDLLEDTRQDEARTDRMVAEAYSLVAARGVRFELREADHVRLREKGLTQEEIGRIRPTLDAFIKEGSLPPHRGKIDRLLSILSMSLILSGLASLSDAGRS
jgi:hypothetical protein